MVTAQERAANQAYNDSLTNQWLEQSAEYEAGRAMLAMDGSSLDTVAYFAREAFHWARVLVQRREQRSEAL